jgi:hypothetical protein
MRIKIVTRCVPKSKSRLVNAAVLPTRAVILRIAFEADIMVIFDKNSR